MGHVLGSVEAIYNCHDFQAEMREAYLILAKQIALILNPPPIGRNVVQHAEVCA